MSKIQKRKNEGRLAGCLSLNITIYIFNVHRFINDRRNRRAILAQFFRFSLFRIFVGYI